MQTESLMFLGDVTSSVDAVASALYPDRLVAFISDRPQPISPRFA